VSAVAPRVALDGHGRSYWLRGDATVWRDDPPGWSMIATIPGATALAGARAGVHVVAPPGLHRLGAGNRSEPIPLGPDLAALTGVVVVAGVPYLAGATGLLALDDAGPRQLLDDAVVGLAARPDGRALYVALAPATVIELELADGHRTPLVELAAPITALAHTPAGLAAIAGGALHGINLRQHRHVLIRGLPEALATASLAAHHRGELILATATVIYRCFGDGSELRELTP
jgi:hypothetical protein